MMCLKMQNKLDFTEQKYINLKGDINQNKLLEYSREYLERLTDHEVVIEATISLIRDCINLDSVVDKLNNADRKLAEKEYSEFIRTFFIPQLTFYAFGQEAGRANIVLIPLFSTRREYFTILRIVYHLSGVIGSSFSFDLNAFSGCSLL